MILDDSGGPSYDHRGLQGKEEERAGVVVHSVEGFFIMYRDLSLISRTK